MRLRSGLAGRENGGAAFAQADHGMARRLAGAAKDNFIAIGEETPDLARRKGQGLSTIAGEFEQASRCGVRGAGDGSCTEYVSDHQVAAVAGVMCDELSRRPVKVPSVGPT